MKSLKQIDWTAQHDQLAEQLDDGERTLSKEDEAAIRVLYGWAWQSNVPTEIAAPIEWLLSRLRLEARRAREGSSA